MNDMEPLKWPNARGEMAELIRTHDWAATPLGPVEQWPRQLRSAVEICLASGFPTLIWWGRELIQLYNDAACSYIGSKHPRALGAPAKDILPDYWHRFGPLVDRVISSGEPLVVEDDPLIIDRRGASETVYFTYCYSLLRDDAGEFGGLFIPFVDTTPKISAELARRESERRQRELSDLFEAAPTPFLVLSPDDFRIVAVNDAYLRATRTTRDAILDHPVFEVFPDDPDDPNANGVRNLRASLEQVIATRRLHAMGEQRYPIRRPAEAGGGFEERWWSPANNPVIASDGSIALIIHRVEDVTERRLTEEALRDREEKFRRIVESAHDYAILTLDADGRITDWFPGAEAVFGWTAEEAIGQPVSITFTSEDQESGVPAEEMRIAAAEGSAPNVRWHQRKDGSGVFIEGTLTALHDRNGSIRGFLKIGQDVTERKRAEEHQRTLLNELQHRVRNILAIIRSVVLRTARSSESVTEYSRHLEGRISALVRTQALLTRDPGSGVDLQNLILDELQAQAAQDRQFICEGPDVPLAPKAAEVLTLAVHELATNSVKYGALSRSEGRLEVRWETEDRQDVTWVRLIWREERVRGGPTPRRHGFGTELITRRVPYELRGRGSVEFHKKEIVATIEFPLGHGESILQTHASGFGTR